MSTLQICITMLHYIAFKTSFYQIKANDFHEKRSLIVHDMTCCVNNNAVFMQDFSGNHCPLAMRAAWGISFRRREYHLDLLYGI